MSISQTIKMENGSLIVPNHPIIPYIEGDGIGPDIWNASVNVFDNAVDKAYKGSRKINWLEILAGEKAFNQKGEWLPQETLDLISNHLDCYKRTFNYTCWWWYSIFKCSFKTEIRFICLCSTCSLV